MPHIARHQAAQDAGQFSPGYAASTRPHVTPIVTNARMGKLTSHRNRPRRGKRTIITLALLAFWGVAAAVIAKL